MKKEKTELKKDRKELEEYAKAQGFKLNPNEKLVDFVIKGLEKNKKEKGEFYCPCRVVSGNKKEDMKIICPCVFHLTEIKEQGHCHCNLFVK